MAVLLEADIISVYDYRKDLEEDINTLKCKEILIYTCNVKASFECDTASKIEVRQLAGKLAGGALEGYASLMEWRPRLSPRPPFS